MSCDAPIRDPSPHKNIESEAKKFSLQERFRSGRTSCKVIPIFEGVQNNRLCSDIDLINTAFFDR
jgi:hypothetical protein